jgi:hypothetical protein
MRRIALPSLFRSRACLACLACLSGIACHSTPTAPAPTVAPPEAAPLAAPLDPSDPAALSGTAEDVAQIDPTLAFVPGGTVVVAWTSLRSGGAPSVVRARFSRDGGATWEGALTLTAPEGRSSLQPAMTTDPAGNVYLAWLGRRDLGDGGAEDSHVYVARADAGSGSFGAPVEVSNETHKGAQIHKPWMASTGKGSVIVTWAYTHTNGDGVGIATTKDGATWKRGIVIERIDLGARFPYVCASAHGEHAWVAYLDADAGVRLRASDDGGESWAPARVATVSLPEDKAHFALETPVCSGEGDDVTVAFARVRGVVTDAGAGVTVTPTSPAASSIVVARAIDGGRSFDIRRTYEAGSQLVLDPQIAREPDGTVDVAFYGSSAERAEHAARGAEPAPPSPSPGPTSDAAALRWFHVDERGAFSPTKIARDHLRFEPSPSAVAWPGSYFGWTWNEGALFVASVDNTEGKPHVAFARLGAPEAHGAEAHGAAEAH